MKKFWRLEIIPFLIIFFSIGLAAAPLLSAFLSLFIADVLNCNLFPNNSCQIGNLEIGKILSNMAVAHWYALATIPIGSVGVMIGLLLLLVISLIKEWRK
jgi:hypothetical protein